MTWFGIKWLEMGWYAVKPNQTFIIIIIVVMMIAWRPFSLPVPLSLSLSLSIYLSIYMSVPIVYRTREVLLKASGVCTELMYVSLC